MRSLHLLLALSLGSMLLAGVARAHTLAPSALLLEERAGGEVHQVWRTPRVRPAGPALRPRLPAACRPLAAPKTRLLEQGTVLEESGLLSCGAAGLASGPLLIEHLGDGQVVLRVRWRDGRAEEALLHAGRPSLHLASAAAPPAALAALRAHIGLGLRHLLGGPDHVLFLAALLVLVRGLRPLLWAISAFTAGHATSLSLAALGGLRVPAAPVEVAIAGTLLWLAVELARRQPGGEPSPRQWDGLPAALACLAAGLLHGLGFAGGLLEAGLPRAQLPLAVLGFNLGLELGQLVVATVVLGGGALLQRVRRAAGDVGAGRRRWSLGLAYLTGPVAVYWILERSWLLVR